MSVKLSEELKNLKLFSGFSEEIVEDFSRLCVDKSYSQGEMILFPGGDESRIFLILEGEVTLYRSAQGKKIVLQVLRRGDFFGDLSLAHGGAGSLPSENFARADKASKLCVINSKDLESFLSTYPKFALMILVAFRDRLHHAESKIKDLAISPAETRLINELIRYAVLHGGETDEFFEIEEKLTHQALSEMIGVTRETVTKTVQKLRETGFVEYTDDRKIRVNKEKVRKECMHCIQMEQLNKM